MNAIEIKDLTAAYGKQIVLDKINLVLPENSFLSIIGPNGAGKSTLIKILLGLKKPLSGEVKVLGSNPENTEPKRVGYVPQIKTMDRNFPAVALDLVVSGLNQKWPWRINRKMKNIAEEALELAGAEKLATRSLSELSGGELQRVCIARSIIKKPELIILDEPAAGIDAVGESDLYKLLEDYQQKIKSAIVMITHDWHIAHHHSDFVLLLNRLQISFNSPKEALSEKNLRRAFGHVGHDHKIKADQQNV